VGGIPPTLTSRQRAASTRPRNVPRAGSCTMASNVSFEPQIHGPSRGSSSAEAPASHTRICRRARASAVSSAVRADPVPSSGAHASASARGPSTTLSRTTLAASLAKPDRAAAGRRPARATSLCHVSAAHHASSTSPVGSAKSMPSVSTCSGDRVSSGRRAARVSAALRVDPSSAEAPSRPSERQ
jgi:hypothetical protein